MRLGAGRRALASAVALAVSSGWGFCFAAQSAQLSAAGAEAYEASLARNGANRAVAWYDARDAYSQIYLRFLDESGNPAGPEQRLTNAPRNALEPDLALQPDQSIVAWYDKDRVTGTLTARLGGWSSAGVALWQRSLSRPGYEGRNAILRVRGERIFCAWLEYVRGQRPWVRAAWFNLRGELLGRPLRVAPASRTTWNLNAALDPAGRAWVVFDALNRTRRSEIFASLVDESRVRLLRLSADDRHASVYPDIAFSEADGGEVAMTWFDERDGNQEVYLFAGKVAELLAGDRERALATRAQRVSHTPGHSIGAYVAWNGASVGLAWCDDSDGPYQIRFQRFDAAARAGSPPLQVTGNTTRSMIPSIVAWGTGFALAWNASALRPDGAPDQASSIEGVLLP
jgi:hypothetical protein